MLTQTTLSELTTNVNTGVEYEIALFMKLLSEDERREVFGAVRLRDDADKIETLYNNINTSSIYEALSGRGLRLEDCSFETQNDKIGPSDLVMQVRNSVGELQCIGLSVKYSNQCTKNCTGRNFISEAQRAELEAILPEYTRMFIDEMTDVYGDVKNWFRHRCTNRITDKYIDLVRDAIIANWGNVRDKELLFDTLFQADSPIEYWVCEFKSRGRYKLIVQPASVQHKDVRHITIAKYQTSYIGFYLQGRMIAKMQVKFNNGFIESVYNQKGKRKRKSCDFVYKGEEMVYGKPFGSWNFSVIY